MDIRKLVFLCIYLILYPCVATSLSQQSIDDTDPSIDVTLNYDKIDEDKIYDQSDEYDYQWIWNDYTMYGMIVGAIVLTPIFLCCIPGCLGFMSGGIESGSNAADMMSYSAVNNGGGVPSNGIVSICQVMGAATCGICKVMTSAGALLVGLIPFLLIVSLGALIGFGTGFVIRITLVYLCEIPESDRKLDEFKNCTIINERATISVRDFFAYISSSDQNDTHNESSSFNYSKDIGKVMELPTKWFNFTRDYFSDDDRETIEGPIISNRNIPSTEQDPAVRNANLWESFKSYIIFNPFR